MRRRAGAALLASLSAVAPAAPATMGQPLRGFPRPLPSLEPGAAELASFLPGHYEGLETRLDGSTRRLTMVVSPVPKSRLGALVLYLEMADAATPNRPFRQRFLALSDPGAGKTLMRVLEPRVPLAIAGKWREPGDLAVFSAQDVQERPGCLVTFRKAGSRYEGGTEGNGCPSSLSGARFMTERFSIAEDLLELTQQGFDAEGRPVWGSPAPVRFRLAPLPTPSTATQSTLRTPSIVVSQSTGSTPSTPSPEAAVEPISAGTTPPPLPTVPTPTPTFPSTPMFPTSVLAPSLIVSGLGGEPRSLGIAELKALPVSEARLDRKIHRGPALRAILERAGLAPDAPGARRLLAAAVVVARNADGELAAFSAEELLREGSTPIVTLGAREPDGALRLIAPGSPARSLPKLVSLELRLLARD